jgi:ribosome-binding protein aMBF1 (putative translation factor)
MDAAIQDDIPEDEIGPRLAELTRTAHAGEEAVKQRARLLRYARVKYGWSQQRLADACPMKQPSVNAILRSLLRSDTT